MLKTKLTLVCILLFFCADLQAQHYAYQKEVGPSEHIDQMTDKTTIMTGPTNEKLSEWQELPFEWSLYGQEVDGFYASDNGYITFDPNAAESIASHEAVPSSTGPNNAIYACWGDWKLGGGRQPSISQYTYGEKPNRRYVVNWDGLAPAGIEGHYYANLFLVLKEEGGFDILMNTSRGHSRIPTPSTVGAENADGSRGVMLSEGPDFTYPNVSRGDNDDITWNFTYTDRKYDAQMISADLPSAVKKGDKQKVSAEIRNRGSETIHSYTANVQVDGGETYTTTIEDVNIPTNRTDTVTFGEEWRPRNAGQFEELSFWVSKINGKSTSSKEFTQKVFVNLGKSVQRKVLLEEFTGAWCGWCPDGMVRINELTKNLDGIIPVALHVRDAMETDATRKLSDYYKPAYPEAMINRELWPNQSSVPVSRMDGRWKELSKKTLSSSSPVGVSIRSQFDKNTRALEAEVTAEFVDYATPGDLRVNLYVVEDEVTGKGEGYNQANYFSGNEDYKGHKYYDKPKSIKGFTHKHVMRKSLSGTWGTQDIIPKAPEPGSSFSKTYEWELPEKFDADEIQLVGFVSYHNSDLDRRYILNVDSEYLLDSGN